ncbi:MAG: hypothetical protein JO254_06425 [Pseudolabrys sp.]|nr:hypothetical protein [Pseudolabrys sp.]
MTPPKRFSWIDGFVIAAVFLIGLVTTARLSLTPRDGAAQVAVVFAPWMQPADAIGRAAEAGATVLNVGRWSSIVIARPERDDYAERAAAKGAWLVADANALLGCLRPATP